MKKYLIFSSPARTILLSLFLTLSFLTPTPAFAKYDFLKKEEVVAVAVQDTGPVSAEFVSFEEPKAGQPYYLGIRLNVQEGWKTYWKNPGESGYPLTIDWTLPEGYEVEEVLWPTPEKSIVQNFVVYGYTDSVTLIAKIKPGKNNGKSIQAKVNWLVCNDETCLPGEAELTLNTQNSKGILAEQMQKMPRELAEAEIQDSTPDNVVLLVPKEVYDQKPAQIEFYPEDSALKDPLKFSHDPSIGSFLEIPKSGTSLKGVLEFTSESGKTQAFDINLPVNEAPLNFGTEVYDNSPSSFGMILLFALIGGLILNLMPCVLPVVSLKVLGFINMAGQSRKKTMLHGALFSAGVLVSFWVLAGIILALREFGHSVGWGFQLQSEAFVGVLAALLLLLALWLFGVFEIGFKLSATTGDMVEKAKKNDNGKLFGSFLSGVLATAVATPCSGPFLGTALGVAVTVPAMQSLLIFTFLGLGMASPYILLAAFPSLLRFLPKPGAWMETFKQLMGFLMLLVVIWLTWVFVSQSDTAALLPLLIGFLLLSFGAWSYGKFNFGFKKKITKLTLLSITVLSTVSGFYYIHDASRQTVMADGIKPGNMEAGWERFSTDAITKLREEGKGVFIDFTAKWCLLCQANLIVLKMPSIEQKMEEMGVVKVMADWTKSDPEITAMLAKFGRNSVPLYIYYPPGKNSKPQVLPQVLTQDIVLNSLDEK